MFKMAGLGVHDADLRVHDAPIRLFTMARSACSRWADARTWRAYSLGLRLLFRAMTIEWWRPTASMSTPDIYLRTAFVLNEQGRILSTREPEASPGPLFSLVRSKDGCAWAVRADFPSDLADELDRLAREEPPSLGLRAAPVHTDRYLALAKDRIGAPHEAVVFSGPAFTFPDALSPPVGLVMIEEERLLERHFRGWVAGEIAGGRWPVLAVVERGYPVSVCFCARRSDTAAEAGVETAEAFRGRGLGPRVTAAWALAIRATGRVPLYSTAWTNDASLALARKLGLVAYASVWSLLG